MYSRRARIGVIAPLDDQVEYAFNKYAPEGVSFDSTRLSFPGPTPEGLIYLSDQLEDAAKMYAKKKHDVILFGCTSGSLIGGPTYDKECIELIERTTGSKGMTTTTAILEGLKKLGASNVALLAPYPAATNEAERDFMEKNGVHITELMDLNPQRQYIPAIEPIRVYQQAKKICKDGAEALFVSCTGLNCLSVISAMEEDFGIPVITSNQASLWACLRLARVGTKIPELGKLFTL